MNKFLSEEELGLRISHISRKVREKGYDAMVISTNANIYYATGYVFSGYVYVAADGNYTFFVHRPVGLEHKNVVYIRKPEQIAGEMEKAGSKIPEKVALELDRIPYSFALRLAAAFSQKELLNGSGILSECRSVKTDYELKKISESGVRHSMTYGRISGIFHEGMRDKELQIEIERLLRLDGCLGQFRIAGQTMELFMGNILAGDNADCPCPYDFAMGGEGLDGSLPVGCNDSIIRPGNSVMVDMNGNFTGYMTDMTRTFYVQYVSDEAKAAHRLSIDIHRALKDFIKPGVEAKEAYSLAKKMADDAGFGEYFMGHRQQAGFIGHGVGIEVNELPVIAPRSKDVFRKNNVIAIEPKFVIPGTGAVGIENTYVVTDNGLKCVTNFPEELIEL